MRQKSFSIFYHLSDNKLLLLLLPQDKVLFYSQLADAGEKNIRRSKVPFVAKKNEPNTHICSCLQT